MNPRLKSFSLVFLRVNARLPCRCDGKTKGTPYCSATRTFVAPVESGLSDNRLKKLKKIGDGGNMVEELKKFLITLVFRHGKLP